MPRDEHEQLREIVAASHEGVSWPSNLTMERVRFFSWALGAIGILLIGGTAWFVRLEVFNQRRDTDIASLQGDLKASNVAIVALGRTHDDYVSANRLLFQQFTSSISDNKKELDKREPILNQLVSDMKTVNFLKDHGISFKEDFFTQKGFWPPSIQPIPASK